MFRVIFVVEAGSALDAENRLQFIEGLDLETVLKFDDFLSLALAGLHFCQFLHEGLALFLKEHLFLRLSHEKIGWHILVLLLQPPPLFGGE